MECLFSLHGSGLGFLRHGETSWSLLGGSLSGLSATAAECFGPACGPNDHINVLLSTGVTGAEPVHDEVVHVRLGTGEATRSRLVLELLTINFSSKGKLTRPGESSLESDAIGLACIGRLRN